ncbi:MAG: FtsX-like permease family protein [Brevinematales bacterium]|jgi:ABC-type lipoprotein release transport system permease subunit
MGLIFKISWRNLFRQKRRNFFLGLAIALGMMILVATSSFTKGLTDTILNRWLIYAYGHVAINGYEEGNRNKSIIRDMDRIIDILKNVKGIKSVNNYLTVFSTIVGNGRSGTIHLASTPGKDELDELKNMGRSGNFSDFTNLSVENPIVLSESKASDLNVKVLDKLGVRFINVNGQMQSARMTLVATQKFLNSGTAGYIGVVRSDNLKKLMGLRPYESGPLQIVLDHMDDPKTAISAADKIRELLSPGLAGYYCEINSGPYKTSGAVLAFYTNSDSMALIESNLPLYKGSWDIATNTSYAAISAGAAGKLRLRGAGDEIKVVYRNKFGGSTTNIYKIGAVFQPDPYMANELILAGENNFYFSYLRNLPRDLTDANNVYTNSSTNGLSAAIGKEWKLLPGTFTADALDKKLRKNLKAGLCVPYYNVSTMYESASFVLDMQSGLDSVSLAAVMILFFVILIGVLNILRMTIRERTREIGTIRAIGMQKEDVKISFILETLLLAFFSCAAGIILSSIILFLISLFPIETDSMFGMFLIDRRLHYIISPGKPEMIFIQFLLFLLQLSVIRFDRHIKNWIVSIILIIIVIVSFSLSGSGNGIFTFLLLILNILVAVAYFPARKAAELPAASALRLYE